MHSTQNERINQITSSTLIVGIDIAKFKHVSVGIKQGSQLTKMELRLLLTQYKLLQKKFEELEVYLDELILYVPQLLAIKGIGRDTIAGFLVEVGDIGQYHIKADHKAHWAEPERKYLR